tara:strand:+ start:1745 stop:2113 length:369 start_codon:yes stop_codon:yes gene_type:complete
MSAPIATTIPDPVVDQLYTQAKLWSEDEPIEAFNAITFTARLIAAVQGIVREPARGSYKKQVVLTVLFRLANDRKDLTEEAKGNLHYVLDTTVPESIDVMIAIGKGEFNLAKTLAAVGRHCC